MRPRNLMAMDIALLLPDGVNEQARAVNAALLAERPDGFRFDATHLPHITLVQQFVQRANLPALMERMDSVLSVVSPLMLRINGVGSSGTAAHFAIEPTPVLRRLHETLMDAVQPLEEAGGSAAAFFADQDSARENDVAWVNQFRSHSSYARFAPHITLGVGPLPEFREPFEFTARRAALCHLGRYCTCRVVLLEWSLGAGDT